MAAMANIVCSTSVFTACNSLWDFCDLKQSDNSINELHLRLFISVRCRHRRPGLGDWGRVKSVSKDRKRLPKALTGTCH